MENEVGGIQKKVVAFKKKYYLNIFLRGSMLSASLLLGYIILASILEYFLWLGSSFRFVLLAMFICASLFCLYRFLKEPLRFWIARRGLSDEQSARLIGQFFPEINDRLVNFFQLHNLAGSSALKTASVRQKANEFKDFSFDKVIRLNENNRYLKYLFVPISIIICVLFINHSIITQSSNRIIHFNQHFSPQAPFQFSIINFPLIAFTNEPFVLEVTVSGKAIPENLYMLYENQRFKMTQKGVKSFFYSFDYLQSDLSFQMEGAGFYSDTYTIRVISRPELTGFDLALIFPDYLQRSSEKITNAGNIQIPEGTKVQWHFTTQNTQTATLLFASDKNGNVLQPDNGSLFSFKKTFREPDDYELILANNDSRNKDLIRYHVDVVKDKYPEVSVSASKDSLLYQNIILSGSIRDDYGVLLLNLLVETSKHQKTSYHKIPIPITKNQQQQNFFFFWQLDSLNLNPGEQIKYYLEVWDNDGVNGSKCSKSALYTFSLPTKEELETTLRKSEQNTEQKITQSQTRAAELQKQLEQASKQIKANQSLSWQDKKKLETIVQQKNELEKIIGELAQENERLKEQKKTFSEESQRVQEKAEQIQKLMDELLDEETKKLFEELEKLLKENSNSNELESVLQKLQQNTGNLEKELDRTLELFKQLQLESKVEQASESLKETIEKQQQLLKETEQVEKSKDQKILNDLVNNQDQLAKEFKEFEKKLDEIKELDKEVSGTNLETPTEEQQQTVEQQQKESKESLKEGKTGKSKQAQQKALKEMKEMQQQMANMQNSMGIEMDMENMESLRQIIHGLIKLSYDQENLITSFRDLNQSDPRFNPLAQQQMKLKDDSKVLEDSLLSLGKRDPMMGAFITKEISELNEHLNKAIEANKERRKSQAQTEMQFSMTSINNLALMLDNHYDMMMQMMANAKPGSGKGKKKGKPQSLSQMQRQLNQRIQQLKEGGKSGKELSEELAKTAAEQERIRRALKEFQEKMKQQGKEAPGGDILNKMEQTEMDLVNKQLTEQLIRRQKEIETRLLEAEQSMREQEEDEERKGETGKDYEKDIPKAYEEYLRLKEKEVELLKTVPPKLYPYYKQEVNEYFKRLRDQ